jgi:hypothetical protein
VGVLALRLQKQLRGLRPSLLDGEVMDPCGVTARENTDEHKHTKTPVAVRCLVECDCVCPPLAYVIRQPFASPARPGLARGFGEVSNQAGAQTSYQESLRFGRMSILTSPFLLEA